MSTKKNDVIKFSVLMSVYYKDEVDYLRQANIKQQQQW